MWPLDGKTADQRKGKAAEDMVKTELLVEGYETERVREGADFKAVRRDFFTGEIVEEKLVEVKSGSSGLTERQKKEKERTENYEVRRRDPLFF